MHYRHSQNWTIKSLFREQKWSLETKKITRFLSSCSKMTNKTENIEICFEECFISVKYDERYLKIMEEKYFSDG